nr:MAG TPA: helix-turn-helix protein [Caudoviricetes sp.]
MPERTERLEPCPWCGETPNEDSYALRDGGYKYGGIVCGCGVQGPDVRTDYYDWPHWKEAAIAAWNRRAPAEAGAPSGWREALEQIEVDLDHQYPAIAVALKRVHQLLTAAPAAPKPSAFQSAGGALPDGMSARQAAVLSLVRQGKSNKCIARELEIAESTVKCHVAVVMRKLGARNRTEVVVKAASRGCA